MNRMVIEVLDSVSKNLINSDKINISELKKSTVMITGATGFIGSMLANLFLYLNKEFNYDMKIILNVRDKSKLSLLENGSENFNFVQVIEVPVERLHIQNLNIDYIFHLAAPTQSKYFIENPVETADSIVFGIKNILELSRVNNVKKILNFSTMEIYGDTDDYITPQKEESLCHLDLYKERSSYPVSKRMAEHYCYLYSKEFDVNVVSLRLVQVIGPGISINDNRVFNQFAKSVIYNSDIELNTDGSQRLAFIHIADLLEGIFYILFSNIRGEAINVINSSNFDGINTIRKLAEHCVSSIANNKIKLRFNIDSTINKRYISSKRVLNSDKFYSLGFIPKVTIEQSMKELVSYLMGEGV
ncbi:3-beta hydroxysteroid dehydrogenase [Rodentibacter pneumotropicus]|uniref:NAD(P)-dependent oxidoreductase n=1 Tax=Rodentibacter pneumotropicus TaxID=758 RepID=A0AAW5LDI1_9PAST|nr:NAD(P)-dependent oxidoreductase [Rodentibacter pneumotropicus]MCQ9121684.1 NAD(P)-dependent oxidoreductase [Rodentibacter pneumotropicus]OOF68577.1 3-beta hydroxysteroid dehydrogenase [Rodentibacter pneumotropicus]